MELIPYEKRVVLSVRHARNKYLYMYFSLEGDYNQVLERIVSFFLFPPHNYALCLPPKTDKPEIVWLASKELLSRGNHVNKVFSLFSPLFSSKGF